MSAATKLNGSFSLLIMLMVAARFTVSSSRDMASIECWNELENDYQAFKYCLVIAIQPRGHMADAHTRMHPRLTRDRWLNILSYS